MRFINTISLGIFFSVLIPPALANMNHEEDPGQHKGWDILLKKHVDEDGVVDYPGFIEDREELNDYLRFLTKNPPKEGDSDKKKLAFWINAYNAFTIKLVIENYPIKSIKEVGATIQIPFVNSPWDLKFFKIGDNKMSLNEVEHKILRKQFDEPRIHFAIVCASQSCPKLRNEAITAGLLDSQLNDQAISFINDSSKNDITQDRIEISKIFSWFKGDFTKKTTLIEYLNKFSKIEISSEAEVKYMKYDWSLNGPVVKGT